MKAKIDKTQSDIKCGICKKRDESTNYILSECDILAQKEYKCRHEIVWKRGHRKVSQGYSFKTTESSHVNESETDTENYKIL